jgi:hypothetical protein
MDKCFEGIAKVQFEGEKSKEPEKHEFTPGTEKVYGMISAE